jgi:hypothetical protein
LLLRLGPSALAMVAYYLNLTFTRWVVPSAKKGLVPSRVKWGKEEY